MIDLRLRTKVPQEELDLKVGKCLGPEDYNLVLSGPARVRKPDGRPLCVYLPGAVIDECEDPGVYEILHSLRNYKTINRGLASGTQRVKYNNHAQAKGVASRIIGAADPQGQQRYCRLTAWTGRNMPEWERLQPLFRAVAGHFADHVPERYAAQKARAEQTDPAWVVPGTPFTTITVNNTYPTGAHKDKGDLDEGFSTIACLRKGPWNGGQLVFAEYRVAVDLQHGDLLLMDAHEWHGNVPIVCVCGNRLNGCCETCGSERISVVSYYRTRMLDCGSPEEEYRRANSQRELAAEKKRTRMQA